MVTYEWAELPSLYSIRDIWILLFYLKTVTQTAHVAYEQCGSRRRSTR
jgi:hypothetical protein